MSNFFCFDVPALGMIGIAPFMFLLLLISFAVNRGLVVADVVDYISTSWWKNWKTWKTRGACLPIRIMIFLVADGALELRAREGVRSGARPGSSIALRQECGPILLRVPQPVSC